MVVELTSVDLTRRAADSRRIAGLADEITLSLSIHLWSFCGK